jgi:hypothetical protein
MTFAPTILPETSMREWIESSNAAWIMVPAGTMAMGLPAGVGRDSGAGSREAAVSAAAVSKVAVSTVALAESAALCRAVSAAGSIG